MCMKITEQCEIIYNLENMENKCLAGFKCVSECVQMMGMTEVTKSRRRWKWMILSGILQWK